MRYKNHMDVKQFLHIVKIVTEFYNTLDSIFFFPHYMIVMYHTFCDINNP